MKQKTFKGWNVPDVGYFISTCYEGKRDERKYTQSDYCIESCNLGSCSSLKCDFCLFSAIVASGNIIAFIEWHQQRKEGKFLER